MVAILASTCSAADNEDFADYKIQKLGETGYLYCNDTDSRQAAAIPEFYQPVAWMLPDCSRVVHSDDKYNIRDDNWTLVINSTTIDDLGVYHCMLQDPNISDSSNFYLVKVGLNSEGPYFFDMWEKYMWPTIISICSLFGFLLLAVICILLYIFRYIPPEKRGGGSDAGSDSSSRHGDGEHDQTLHKLDHRKEHEIDVNHKEHNAYENPSFHDGDDGKEHQHNGGMDLHEAKQNEAHHVYADVRDHHKTVEERGSSDEEATTF